MVKFDGLEDRRRAADPAAPDPPGVPAGAAKRTWRSCKHGCEREPLRLRADEHRRGRWREALTEYLARRLRMTSDVTASVLDTHGRRRVRRLTANVLRLRCRSLTA